MQGKVSQPGVLGVPDAVLAPGPTPVAQFQIRQLPAAGVRGKRRESISVHIGEPQLGSGVGSFGADDDPHPFGPPGQVRTWAISAKQSPPIATEIARSKRTFPGSCIANGRIHGRNAVDSSRSNPTFPAVAASSAAPAWATTLFAVVPTVRDG